ncbi:uncharacterized protein LOC116419476 [Sarcophilus harrisii]|uniref:uncharacterized protein LOC116419476 n=1 Tax=Sarcophilus harrisii TaxID=9305 RepID=UPI0013019F06|nr:uncharacterized protein LOC116419476 [Sarcophilus harrisii]
MFRGLRPRIAPLSIRSNEQGSDLEGQGNIVPTRRKVKGRIGDPAWLRSLAFAAPPMTQAVPVQLIDLFPTTTSCFACDCRGACVPPRNTKVLPTLAKTSTDIVLEPSSDWPQGEAFRPQQSTPACPSTSGVPQKWTSKVHPAMAGECQTSHQRRSSKVHPAMAGECQTSHQRRSSKIHPAMAGECQTSHQRRSSKIHPAMAEECQKSPHM